MGKLVFVSGDAPKCSSQKMDRLAKHFWEMKQYYHDARRSIEQKWKQCDEAYLCYRWLPDTGSMDWIDDSEFGETDGFDNVNTIVWRMLQSILPAGQAYINPSASDPDEPFDTTESVRDFLMFKYRQTGCRRQLGKWMKMMTIRGDGGFYWEHSQEFEYHRVIGTRAAAAIEDALKTRKIKDTKSITDVMEKVCITNGPTIRVIDTHDYFLSPISDLTNQRCEPFIVQTFRHLHELQEEVDDNDNPVYENLDGLEGSYAYDLFGRMNDGVTRIRSLQIMGLAPEASRDGTRLVPVYIVFCPYIKFEEMEFYNTYFHIALNSGGKSNKGGMRMIRVEKNPTNQRQFLFDNYIDFCTNTPYGISTLEKSLTYLRQKNVLGGLMFNAAVAVEFPAMNVNADAFIDSEVSFAPGATNLISGAHDLNNVMQPVPSPEKGLQLAWSDMKFWGDELRAKMGIDGLQPSTPTRTMSKNKTATEVTHDASSGNLFLDEMGSKWSDTLTTFFQGSFDVMKDKIEPDEKGYLEYERNLSGRVVRDTLSIHDLKKPRSITLGFSQGIFDKGQRLASVVQMQGMVAQLAPFMPNAAGIIQDLVQEAARLTQVPIKPQSFMSPEQLASENPKIQVMAIQSAMQQIGQAAQQGRIMPPKAGSGGVVDA